MSLNQPILPYAGTSGWSGSESSRDRAREQDSDGTTLNRQNITLDILRERSIWGITWKELSERTGWHHGSASGVLSVLHKENKIIRLKDRRNKCAIYILAVFANGRERVEYKTKTCKHCGGHL